MNLEDILKKGYFPKELPPPFNTNLFSDFFKSQRSFKGMKGNKNKSMYLDYSIPKTNYFRTKVGVINPYNFLVLAEVIINNFSAITTVLNKSILTTSKPNINNYFRTEFSYGEFKDKALLDSINTNVILITDISRFYSSIYTHSIPWALHTKATAKANRDNSLYGNLIDTELRNCQDQQTNGIPIGPITSNIIAEIILCEIDDKLKTKINKGKRYVDDYMLFFNNISDAENAFKELQKYLLNYQLEINSNKTKIENMPYQIEENWINDLTTFFSNSLFLKQKSFLTKLYNKVLELKKANPNKYVIKYLLTILKDIFIEEDNWKLFETYLLNLTRLDTSILPDVLIIIKSYHSKYNFSLGDIEDFYKILIRDNVTKGNHYEVSWSLWSLYELNFIIDNDLAKDILNSEDWISKIIIFHLNSEHKISGSLTSNISIENVNIDELDLYNNKWLFTYETLFNNWLNDTNGILNNDRFFKKLKDNNISFYNKTIRSTLINLDALRDSNKVLFEIDNSSFLSDLNIAKTKISNAEEFDEVKDAYIDLLSCFESYIEDINSEFSEHIKELLDKKRNY
ncbi:RNA-directed DNA polymerase [Aliarcobacter butzleri]|nr:RNA-directed DNA polymerase [Aliarcobacter butzleri]